MPTSFAGWSQASLLLIAMSILTFALFFASTSIPRTSPAARTAPRHRRKRPRKALGYDDNWLVQQWGKFAKGVFVGRDYPDDPALKETAPETVVHCPAPCLGYSKNRSATVTSLIQQTLPVTVSIAIIAFVFWITGGVILGVIAALKGHDHRPRPGRPSLVLYAFPTFFVGLLLYKFVAIQWGWVDVPSYTTIADGGITGWLPACSLPGVTLAAFFMAAYVRMTRAYVLESLSEDYVRTARAKGLPNRTVTYKHALRAALTPHRDDGRPRLRRTHGRGDHHRVGLQLPGYGQARGRAPTTTSTCPPWSGW